MCSLCMLEFVEGELSLLEVPEAMRCVLLFAGGVCGATGHALYATLPVPEVLKV